MQSSDAISSESSLRELRRPLGPPRRSARLVLLERTYMAATAHRLPCVTPPVGRLLDGLFRVTAMDWTRTGLDRVSVRARLAGVRVLSRRANDRVAVEAFLAEHGSLRVARRGELLDSLDHPALLMWAGDDLVGVATYVVDGEACELLTLHAQHRYVGVGTALLEAVVTAARVAGCWRLWVVTTNDNVDALRFYQRRGFRLAQLRTGAVEASRETLKPEIPPIGAHDIPLRDEL